MRPIERCLSVITAGDGDPGLVRDELRALKGRKKRYGAGTWGELPRTGN
jgi:hypothetical protein